MIMILMNNVVRHIFGGLVIHQLAIYGYMDIWILILFVYSRLAKYRVIVPYTWVISPVNR